MSEVPNDAARRVFVAGATGVLGHRVVTRLVAHGFAVTGVARSEEKAGLLRRLGATPSTVDLFDADAVRGAVAGHGVVLNLATHIPSPVRSASPSAWVENDRIRREVSTNLVDAALAAGAGVLIQEALSFAHADGGDRWLDATEPLESTPITEAVFVAEAEVARFSSAATGWGGRGIVARFGLFHAPEGEQSELAVRLGRRGWLVLPGEPDGYQSVIHIDDAAEAVVALVDAPAGTYEVVDDEPLTRIAYAGALADAVGRKKVRLLPSPVRRQVAARSGTLAFSHRVSNRELRDATGWRPAHPSARETFADLLSTAELRRFDRRGPDAAGSWQRLALWWLLLGGVLVGAWALVAPQSFYDVFPGGGQAWVSVDGPFNEHLVRDVGALNLALAAATAWALTSGWRAGRAIAVAWLVYAVPHFAYHVVERHGLEGIDQALMLGSLSLSVVAALIAIISPRRATPRRVGEVVRGVR